MTHSITLVDDDQNILTSISMALKSEGFEVTSHHNGEAALSALKKTPANLVVLDIKMPSMDGMEVLEKLREFSKVPVIFLTSKDDEVDQVLGLRMGADDYITKPFSQRLLLERIRTILRREDMRDNINEELPKHTTITCGPLVLDDTRHECRWDEKLINLTVTEYLLLKTLATKPGHVKSREQLIEQAYGENIYVDDRTVDSHIKRIRKKIKTVYADFENIETLYGIGYKYKED